MKLKREYKKSLDLILLSKVAILTFLITPLTSLADPVVAGQVLPPASFTHVENYDMLLKLGLTGGAWCYDDDANAILISAPAHEKAKCELNLQYEREKLKTKHQFEIDRLKLRISTLVKQHEEINLIKDEEIKKLTEAALKRPNDYSVWWASGGFTAGVLTVVGIILLL